MVDSSFKIYMVASDEKIIFLLSSLISTIFSTVTTRLYDSLLMNLYSTVQYCVPSQGHRVWQEIARQMRFYAMILTHTLLIAEESVENDDEQPGSSHRPS